uniref:Zinc finger protein RFP-like n=1 Tax=Pelusios castaneus TaxID=367368 RepID=A0A8C8SPU0_9SAUR
MAAVNAAQTLQDETTCQICLEYFDDPVLLDCDHNFCRNCIIQCWEGSQKVSCPHCRQTFPQRNLRPNRQLRNIVEAARGLRLESVKKAETEGLCEKHREPLKLFCEDEQIPICGVCDGSKEHRDHTVIPAEEAAEDFKVGPSVFSSQSLGKLPFPKTQTERQKIVSEFQQLRQFLEKQERLLLAQLENLDEEMVMIQTENIAELSAEISRLSELISEVEGKCQKPDTEFLQVRLIPASPRAELCPNALILPPVTVTLDPDTAHPFLVLSEDGKSVILGNTRQDLPNNPERFDTELWVLGHAGFTSGRHCWEVEVGYGPCWAVGVARESLRRKGDISCSPEGGIWAVGRRWGMGQFRALTSPVTPLHLSRVPSSIRVCLDCDRGKVTFFDDSHLPTPRSLISRMPGSSPPLSPTLCSPRDGRGRRKNHCWKFRGALKGRCGAGQG